MMARREDANSEYKIVKSELKDVDYARQAIDDYIKMQKNIQEHKHKKNDLE